eukprot:GHVU01188336.1.p1 GENE.GHVU01188336.1~~GHVU01188336.1.p1  ORF type:complete len:562 (+),score=122.74 GHVU01188336.1:201-1886(+)
MCGSTLCVHAVQSCVCVCVCVCHRRRRRRQGLALLLYCAYDELRSRARQLEVTMHASLNAAVVLYPVCRLFLQGVVANMFKNTNKLLGKYSIPAFPNPQVAENFRAMGVAIDQAYSGKLQHSAAGRAVLDVVHGCQSRVGEALETVLLETQDDIPTQLAMTLYIAHFDNVARYVSIRSGVLARMANILKEYEGTLNLSLFDPVAETITAISETVPPFDAEALRAIDATDRAHNLMIDHRFIMSESNVVFDLATSAPVPQQLAHRQQADIQGGKTVVSLLSRYAKPEPKDPRQILHDALKTAPYVKAATFEKLANELRALESYYSSQSPPDYDAAKLMKTAAEKCCDNYSREEMPVSTTLRWLVNDMRLRRKHYDYLIALQKGVKAIEKALRHYRFGCETKEHELERVRGFLGKPAPEMFIQRATGSVGVRSAMERAVRVLEYHSGANAEADEGTAATRTFSIQELHRFGVIRTFDPGVSQQEATTSRATITSSGDGGWRVQVICGYRSAEKTLTDFDLSFQMMEEFRLGPRGSVYASPDGKLSIVQSRFVTLTTRILGGTV